METEFNNSIQALDIPATIVTESQADEARAHREALRDLELQIKEHYRPAIEALRTMTADRSKHLKALEKIDTRYKDALAAYEQQKYEQQRAIVDQIKATVERAQSEALGKQVAELLNAGDNQAALAIANEPLPLVPLPQAKATGGTSVRVTVEVVDIDSIKDAYLKPRVPNMAKINAVAKARGKDVETIVGGVRYVEKVVPRRKSRKDTGVLK